MSINLEHWPPPALKQVLQRESGHAKCLASILRYWPHHKRLLSDNSKLPAVYALMGLTLTLLQVTFCDLLSSLFAYHSPSSNSSHLPCFSYRTPASGSLSHYLHESSWRQPPWWLWSLAMDEASYCTSYKWPPLHKSIPFLFTVCRDKCGLNEYEVTPCAGDQNRTCARKMKLSRSLLSFQLLFMSSPLNLTPLVSSFHSLEYSPLCSHVSRPSLRGPKQSSISSFFHPASGIRPSELPIWP